MQCWEEEEAGKKLFEEAMQLNAKGELFSGGKNTQIDVAVPVGDDAADAADANMSAEMRAAEEDALGGLFDLFGDGDGYLVGKVQNN
eukprot:COSAG05_NODE_15605_length_365_cov_1.394737_1_plen_86_part_01